MISYCHLLRIIALSGNALLYLSLQAQTVQLTPAPPVEVGEMVSFDDLSEEQHLTLEELLHEILENPVDINAGNHAALVDAGLITMFQANKLKEYIFMYGPLLSFNELRYMDGWDEETAARIGPFITLSGKKPLYHQTAREYKPRIKSDAIIMVARVLEGSQGYEKDLSADDQQTSPYAGSPWRFSFRYDLKYGRHLEFGLRSEKDPGEEFWPYHPENRVNMNYPDHLSGFILLKDMRFLRRICIGDFHFRFGRGMTITSGGGFSYWKDPFHHSSAHSMVRANTSLSELGYLRGAAMEAGISKVSVGLFLSATRHDPSGMEIKSPGIATFSSISQTGYHRTSAEIERRGRLEIVSFGIAINYTASWFRAGLVACRSSYSMPRHPSGQLYSSKSITGRTITNYGGYAEAYFRKTTLFFEVSLSDNLKASVTGGYQVHLSPGIRFSFNYRHFPVSYHPGPHARGAGPYMATANESGVSIGIEMGFRGRWVLRVVGDWATSPWLRYGADFCSRKYAWFVGVTKQHEVLRIMLAYTYYQKDENQDRGFGYLSPVLPAAKHRADAQILAFPGIRWRYKTRISASLAGGHTITTDLGTMLQQEVTFLATGNILNVSAGAIFFHTDNYETGLTAYEPNLLYSSGNIMLSDRGNRLYLAIHWKVLSFLEIWLKGGITSYSDKQTLGSGLDEIPGNRKTEIRGQVRLRF